MPRARCRVALDLVENRLELLGEQAAEGWPLLGGRVWAGQLAPPRGDVSQSKRVETRGECLEPRLWMKLFVLHGRAPSMRLTLAQPK